MRERLCAGRCMVVASWLVSGEVCSANVRSRTVQRTAPEKNFLSRRPSSPEWPTAHLVLMVGRGWAPLRIGRWRHRLRAFQTLTPASKLLLDLVSVQIRIDLHGVAL